jgi:hypothetical protein
VRPVACRRNHTDQGWSITATPLSLAAAARHAAMDSPPLLGNGAEKTPSLSLYLQPRRSPKTYSSACAPAYRATCTRTWGGTTATKSYIITSQKPDPNIMAPSASMSSGEASTVHLLMSPTTPTKKSGFGVRAGPQGRMEFAHREANRPRSRQIRIPFRQSDRLPRPDGHWRGQAPLVCP